MMGCALSSTLVARLSCNIVTDIHRRQSYSGRRLVPQHEFLSDREKVLIARTWKLLAGDMVGTGTDVFMRIFELAPEARDAFPTLRALPQGQLDDDIMFRSHATRFMRAVACVMSNLDALDVIVSENLVRLGRYHAAAVTHFRVEYLAVFETAMMDVWARRLGWWRFDSATRRAWRKVFHLITSRVNDGYNEYLAGSAAVSPEPSSCQLSDRDK